MPTAFTTAVGQVRVWDRWKSNELTEFWTPKYPFVTGISVVLGINIVSSVSVTFDIPFEEGIELINNSTFATGNLMAVRIGYPEPSMMTPWFYGVMTNGGDSLTVESGGVTGTITTTEAPQNVWSEPGGDDKVDEKTAYDLFGDIATRLGFVIKYGDDAHTKLTLFLIGEKPPVIHGSMSNWEILRFLSDEYNVRYWMGVDDSSGTSVPTLFVMTDKDMLDGVPARKYVMRGRFDPLSNQWPILSWAPISDPAIWDGAVPNNYARGASSSYVDDEKGGVVTVKYTPEEMDQYIHGVIAENAPEDKEVEGVKIDGAQTERATVGANLSVPADGGQKGEDDVTNKLRSVVESGSRMLQSSISTVGAPWEVPTNIALVGGMGKRFDGSFIVDKVTHIFAPGDFSSTIDVRRRGTTVISGQGSKTLGGDAPDKDNGFSSTTESALGVK